MTAPTPNNYTVQVADNHSHSVSQAGIASASKLDAALSVMQNAIDYPAAFAALVTTDNWTITISQP